jgi:hypothetical protein
MHHVWCPKCKKHHAHFTSDKTPPLHINCGNTIPHEAWAKVKYRKDMEKWTSLYGPKKTPQVSGA